MQKVSSNYSNHYNTGNLYIYIYIYNAARCFEQILEAAPHKTVAVPPLTFQLKNHPSKTIKTFLAQLEK